MGSYLSSSDSAIIYELPYLLSDRTRQVDNLFSVSTKDVELNIKEHQIIMMDDMSLLSVIDHVINDGFDIIDGVDTEVLNQVLLGFPLLPDCKDSLAPCPNARSTTPTTTPQKNSLLRTSLIHSMNATLQRTVSYPFIALLFHTPLSCSLKPITLFRIRR
jgi:hypothetical protein